MLVTTQHKYSNPPIISCASINNSTYPIIDGLVPRSLSVFFFFDGIWLGLTGKILIVGKWASPYLSLLHGDTLWCISASCDMCCQCTALTGGLFRVTSGLKPTIGGMVLGTLLRYIYMSAQSCDHTAWEGASGELVLPCHGWFPLKMGSLDYCSRVIGLSGPNITAIPVPSCYFFKAGNLK